jgi:hypothetical protein
MQWLIDSLNAIKPWAELGALGALLYIAAGLWRQAVKDNRKKDEQLTTCMEARVQAERSYRKEIVALCRQFDATLNEVSGTLNALAERSED